MFSVRTVGEESQDAAVSICGQRMKVESLSVDRRGIDLEIPRVNDRARRSLNRKCEGIDYGVRDVEKLDLERSDFHEVFRFRSECSAFVLSEKRARTPRSPYAASV